MKVQIQLPVEQGYKGVQNHYQDQLLRKLFLVLLTVSSDVAEITCLKTSRITGFLTFEEKHFLLVVLLPSLSQQVFYIVSVR